MEYIDQNALFLKCVFTLSTFSFKLFLCTHFKYPMDSLKTNSTLFHYLTDPSIMIDDVTMKYVFEACAQLKSEVNMKEQNLMCKHMFRLLKQHVD